MFASPPSLWRRCCFVELLLLLRLAGANGESLFRVGDAGAKIATELRRRMTRRNEPAADAIPAAAAAADADADADAFATLFLLEFLALPPVKVGRRRNDPAVKDASPAKDVRR